MLACGYEVYVASEFHGLTRSIIKSVNFRVHPLQKILIRCESYL